MKCFYNMDMMEIGEKFASILSDSHVDVLHGKEHFDEVWKRYCEFGIFNMLEMIGRNENVEWNDLVSFIFGVGLGSDKIGVTFAINVQIWACILPIMSFKSNIQQEGWLRKLISGEMICAHAISEDMAGSDVFNISTTYEKSKDGFVLNGTKNYVSNAPYANLYMVYAKEKGTEGYRNVTCFLIPKETKGVYVGEVIEKMGMEESPMASLYLKDCVVEKEMLLGKEGQGIFIFNHAMLYERPLLLAFQVGMMERQLRRCVKFCKVRKQKKKKIIDYQSVSNRLADMKVNVEACKLFIQDIIARLNEGTMSIERSAIAKLFVSEKLVENSMLAIRNYGTYGYLKECVAEQNMRDSLGALFYSGTSDIQRNIITQEIRHYM